MTQTDPSDNPKRALRQQAMAVRQRLPMAELSHALCTQLAQWTLFQESSRILSYDPFRNEVNLTPLFSQFPEKTWFLPRVQAGGHLSFHRYKLQDTLTPGAYGILEPDASQEALTNFQEGDLILTPGLAFDRQGYRLGYGKGYYDRLLASCPPDEPIPWVVGIIPEVLLLPALPTDPWDRPMQFIVTEQSILSVPALPWNHPL